MIVQENCRWWTKTTPRCSQSDTAFREVLCHQDCFWSSFTFLIKITCRKIALLCNLAHFWPDWANSGIDLLTIFYIILLYPQFSVLSWQNQCLSVYQKKFWPLLFTYSCSMLCTIELNVIMVFTFVLLLLYFLNATYKLLNFSILPNSDKLLY